MTYAFLLTLAVLVAFAAFGLIAYTAGRARGVEAGAAMQAHAARPDAPRPEFKAPAPRQSTKELLRALPERFTTATLAALYAGHARGDYRRCARPACQMTQRWLARGLVRRLGRARFEKTPAAHRPQDAKQKL